jgi:Na+-translocating ferredoxin:NAD+ oxidoreductase RnfG subunit
LNPCFKKQLQWIGLAIVLASPMSLLAEVYLTSQQFVDGVFGANSAKLETLWMTKEVVAQTDKILGHAPKQSRLRYWKNGQQTAWILDEIGKEEPITAGFVVENGKITQATVLAYRESRGWEVRYANFLKQYQGVSLQPDSQLNKNIDGISGATLSVRAMGRMARLALYYDQISRTESSASAPAKP